MQSLHLEAAVQVVTILGGVVSLLLATLKLADTWLDIGDKLRKRRRAQKRQQPTSGQHRR